MTSVERISCFSQKYQVFKAFIGFLSPKFNYKDFLGSNKSQNRLFARLTEDFIDIAYYIKKNL